MGTEDSVLHYPSLLLISGSGRDVGKTLLACRIIRHLARRGPVAGIKISLHHHAPSSRGRVIASGRGYLIVREEEASEKDSGRMVAAGADPVFFVTAGDEALREVFRRLQPLLGDRPVVCEAGGLRHYIKPGLFLFVRDEKAVPPEKSQLLQYHPVVVRRAGDRFDLPVEKITWREGKILYGQ